MAETLLSATKILLFGRVVEDLKIAPTAQTGKAASDATGTRNPLEEQLRAEGANFARIYAFSHDGLYHILPRPPLFLVHGAGQAASEVLCGADGVTPHANLKFAGGEEGALPFTPDVRVWSCDKGDHSIRLDLQTGLLDQLLQGGGLEQKGMSVSGMSAQGMSVSGMSITGMSISGMSVAGMSVAGMSVAGMSITPPKPDGSKKD